MPCSRAGAGTCARCPRSCAGGRRNRPRPSEIYDRLADFIDAAEICLDAAMLPPFYPPHLIEQSMLLSVVYAGRTESDTAEIYEQLCSAVIERRKSKNRP